MRVFGFSCRKSGGALFLQAPSGGASSESNNIATDRFLVSIGWPDSVGIAAVLKNGPDSGIKVIKKAMGCMLSPVGKAFDEDCQCEEGWRALELRNKVYSGALAEIAAGLHHAELTYQFPDFISCHRMATWEEFKLLDPR